MKRDAFYYQLKDVFSIVDSTTDFLDENEKIIRDSEKEIEKCSKCYNGGYSYNIPF